MKIDSYLFGKTIKTIRFCATYYEDTAYGLIQFATRFCEEVNADPGEVEVVIEDEHLVFVYDRPATPEEVEAEVTRRAAEEAKRLESERKRYEILKKKFEPEQS